MNTKKKNRNFIIMNIATYSVLFSTMINQYVYATGNDVVDNILVEVTQVLLILAGLVCLGKLIQIGILFMTSSAVEKSQAKTALMPWLVGTMVAFGASMIGPAIIRMISNGYDNVGPLDY